MSEAAGPFGVLLESARDKLAGPAAVVLGSPVTAAGLVEGLGLPGTVCYQLDLHQAGRLREILQERDLDAAVEVRPDLWDLPGKFRTLVQPISTHGERELKIDMIDQAYHVLEPGGYLVSLSKYRRDQLCPKWHKKAFGNCGEAPARRDGGAFWSRRGDADKPRRRHEITFHAKLGPNGTSCEFVSRPGVFSYGRFDEGARALLEVTEVPNGSRVLDLGCGVGADGVLAAVESENVHVTLTDSNVRAVELARLNAEKAGLTNFEAVAAPGPEVLADESFDIILTNPPYYANLSIARRFVREARRLLKPGGRLSLVTKQIHALAPLVTEAFEGEVIALARRGYNVIQAEG